ncbi:hypothetical protein SeLEV6574_g05897 [Synchytrium endobioticum]|nr:hypothetical protein SeLEV6574_g05897 [Synchytrium endobioticum]
MSSRAKVSRDNLTEPKAKSSKKDSHVSLNAASSAPPAAPSAHANTITLTIKLGPSRNLKGNKGDRLCSFVRVQFADFEPEESPVVADNANPNYAFTVDLTLPLDDALIDAFGNRKLAFTLMESLPKEKTAVLATAEVSMAHQFLKYPPRPDHLPQDAPSPTPELSFSDSLTWVYATPKMIAGFDPPTMDIDVSLSKVLIPPADWDTGVLFTLTIADVAPVPDEWSTKEASERDLNSNIYTYTLNFPLYGESGEEKIIAFPGGMLINADQPSTMELPVGSQPIYLPKPASPSSEAKPPMVAASAAVLTSEKPDKSVPVPSKRVEWPSTVAQKCIWISKPYMTRLRERVQSRKPVEFEFLREPQPRFASLADTQSSKFRGRVLVDCASLLFPRVIGFKGRFTVECNERFSLTDKIGGMGSETSMHVREGKSKIPKDSGDVYRNIGTSLGIEILLDRPLIDKKKLQPITNSVSDYIPRRKLPLNMVYEHAGDIAAESFRDRITELVRTLVTEYRQTLGDDALTEAQGQAQVSDQEKQFFYYLNRTGAYFRLKERLKGAVVEVVRGKFRKTAPFASQAELQVFLSEAYVFLLDEMHCAINQIFTNPSILTAPARVSGLLKSTHDPSTVAARRKTTTTALAKHAHEAERYGDIHAASCYHRERIGHDEDDADAWFEYAAFELRTGGKGVEALHEVLSRFPNHVNSLIAHGAMASAAGQADEARVCLHAAVDTSPRNALALVTLSLHYTSVAEEAEAEKYMLLAQQAHPSALYAHCAAFYVHVHASGMAETALSHALLLSASAPSSASAYLALATLEARRSPSRAFEHLRKALDIKRDEPAVWAELGHLHFAQGEYDDATLCYETATSMAEGMHVETPGLGLVYARLGELALAAAVPGEVCGARATDAGGARVAKAMSLRACVLEPCSRAWMGVGRAAWALDELVEAEDAFAEANVLNNRDGEVWACLALLCGELGRGFEAEQCVRHGLNAGLRNLGLLKQMGKMFAGQRSFAAAKECLLVALVLDPDEKESRQLLMDIEAGLSK